MPDFVYKAKTGPSDVISGVIHAETQAEAVDKILRLGQTPLEITLQDKIIAAPVKSVATHAPKGVKVPSKLLVIFIRQLADLVDAGVPIIRSLDIMRQQKNLASVNACLTEMVAQIKGGKSLSAAMAGFPTIFSNIIINMVKAGESSGSLSQVLARLADVMEQELVLTQKLKSAMTYPFMVMGVGIMTLVALLVFVLPKLTSLFDDLDVTLPLTTQFIIGLSQLMSQWWWLMLAGVIGLNVIWSNWIRTSAGKQWKDETLLSIPFIGPWISKVELARWTRMMGTLIGSGMTVVSAMDASLAVCDNERIRQRLRDASLAVRSGRGLKQVVASLSVFDEMTISLLSIGEESGDMAKSFLKIASIYERDSTHQATVAADIAGPLVLIIIVSIIGVMIVSMMMPIFQMNLMVN